MTTRVDLLFDAYIPLFERGDLGRSEFYTQTDASLKYRYRFGRDNRYALQFNIDVLNLFNQAAVLQRYEQITDHVFEPADFELVGVTIDGTPDDASGYREFDRAFFDGRVTADRLLQMINTCIDVDPGPIVECDAIEPDVRFNQPQFFQAPRSVRFGFRFTF
jgi:hypothetical protein